jgi:hypothetical protein
MTRVAEINLERDDPVFSREVTSSSARSAKEEIFPVRSDRPFNNGFAQPRHEIDNYDKPETNLLHGKN